MTRLTRWTQVLLIRKAVPMRRIAIPFTTTLALLMLFISPASADQAAVDAARADYKKAVALAVKTHNAAIAKAKADFEANLRAAGEPTVVANAQAKALAGQATKISQARALLDQALTEADRAGDRQARAKAWQGYEQALRKIQKQTERALGDARELAKAKTARERAILMREQAMRLANETFVKALDDARARLNAVLIANGYPPERS